MIGRKLRLIIRFELRCPVFGREGVNIELGIELLLMILCIVDCPAPVLDMGILNTHMIVLYRHSRGYGS